ncbi:hypothetical protein [Luteipulveratus mongoliensis]|uniref:hypothetical protein n=1 Tax=Luteipulveratus mongoliensis TaxID=571913 RepID=UPI0012EE988F|nr:hypothetical protein [Luteipulveratus mongoliensis]
MKPANRRPFRVFWAIFAFISCICALISLTQALADSPVDTTHAALLLGVTLVAGILGYALIRKPKF